MNPFLALLALNAFNAKPTPASSSSTTSRVQRAHKKPTKKAAPKWPGLKYPPPPSALRMPAVPAMPHEQPEHPTTTPADQAERGDEPAHAVEPHATEHHDAGQQLSELHAQPPTPADAAQHVEQHAQPAKRRKRRTRVVTMPAHTVTARPQQSSATQLHAVADTQKILRGLGWKGHLTTKGAVSPKLTDGDFGPVTRDNWQQSAGKRKLDPTFERVGPQSVRVNAATYAALAKLTSGGVAGLRLP